MAKKSKTQRAKASARRAEKKAAALEEIENPKSEVEEVEEKPKKSLFSKSEEKQEPAPKQSSKKAVAPKKKHFKFFREVRAEMKRVTWPTRQDVLQWSGVVIVALLFFGVYVAILDSGIITPLLIAFSSLSVG